MKDKISRWYIFLVFMAGGWAFFRTISERNGLKEKSYLATTPYKASVLSSTLKGLQGLLIFLGIISLVGLVLFLLSWKYVVRYRKILDSLTAFLSRRKPFVTICIGCGLLALTAGQLTLYYQHLENLLQQAFLIALQPFFLFVIFSSLLSLGWILYQTAKVKWITKRKFWFPLLLSFLVYAVLVYLTNEAGLGFSSESETLGLFHPVGFPLLGYQVFLAWLGCVGLIWFLSWMAESWQEGRGLPLVWVDILLGVLLFLLAFSLWNTAPLETNWFVDVPRPPNFERYPNSDALFYDTNAQNLLALGKYWNFDKMTTVGRRPVMLLFHAFLHAVGGLGYEEITPYLVAALASLPILVYALGVSLHSRLAGLLSGVLVIIRHRNGLLLGDIVTGANVKLLMSEVLTTMGVVVFVLLIIHWLKRPRRRLVAALLAGAVLGIAALIRSELFVMFPAVSLPAFFVYRGRMRSWLKGMILIGVGFLLFVVPWVGRNWVQMGEIYIDTPGNKLDHIRETIKAPSLIEDEGTLDPDFNGVKIPPQPIQFPQINTSSRSAGMVMGVSAAKVPVSATQNVTGDEGAIPTILEILANHFVNGMMESFLYLPHTPLMLEVDYLSQVVNQNLQKTYGGLLYAPEKYVRNLPYWGEDWNGRLQQQSMIGFSITVLIVGWGIYALWERHRAMSFVPLMVFLGLIAVYSVVRYSGGRFLQKADWVISFCYSIGLIELTDLVGKVWTGEDFPAQAKIKDKKQKVLEKWSPRWYVWGIVSSGILLAGSILPLMEAVLPSHYTEVEKNWKVSEMLATEGSPLTNEEGDILEGFLANGGEVIYGRALYPRYFQVGEKMINEREVRSYPSLEFYLVGTDVYWAKVLREEPPDYFPHGLDVLAVGCLEKERSGEEEKACINCLDLRFNTVAVILLTDGSKQDKVVYWRDGDVAGFSSCPLPQLDTEE